MGGLASPDLHAIVILFAGDVAERERSVREHQQYATQFPGVEALSTLDLGSPRHSSTHTITSAIAIASLTPRSRNGNHADAWVRRSH